MYIPDDVSQIPDNHPGYIPAQEDRLKRLNLALHKRLDTVIDQGSRPDLPDPEKNALQAYIGSSGRTWSPSATGPGKAR